MMSVIGSLFHGLTLLQNIILIHCSYRVQSAGGEEDHRPSSPLSDRKEKKKKLEHGK